MAGAAEHRLERWQGNVDDGDVEDGHDGAYHHHARDLQHSGIDLVRQIGQVDLAVRRHVIAPCNGFVPVYAHLARNPPYAKGSVDSRHDPHVAYGTAVECRQGVLVGGAVVCSACGVDRLERDDHGPGLLTCFVDL